MKTAFKANGRLIPTHFITDTNLTYAEQGMLVSLYCGEEPKDKDIYNSLIYKGYIEQDKKGELVVKAIPKPKEIPIIVADEEKQELPQKTKKPTLVDKCLLEIDLFTKDAEVKKALRDYLFIRLNPDKNSRLYDKRLASTHKFKILLNQLNTMRGNKLDIVRQSIIKEWAVFVDIEPKDSASSDTLTDEERARLDRDGSISF